MYGAWLARAQIIKIMYAVVLNVGRRAPLLVLADLVVHPPIRACCSDAGRSSYGLTHRSG